MKGSVAEKESTNITILGRKIMLNYFTKVKNVDLNTLHAVMRIRSNYYTDPDPGSGNPPYKSGSKEKTSQNSIFQNFVEKTYVYKIG